jgi:hypothetical protein
MGVDAGVFACLPALFLPLLDLITPLGAAFDSPVRLKYRLFLIQHTAVGLSFLFP